MTIAGKRYKYMKQCICILLTIALFFSMPPMVNLAAEDISGSQINFMEQDQYYSIKTKRYIKLKDGVPDGLSGGASQPNLLTDENAIVKKYVNGEGKEKYHVWISFSSYSTYDVIQVMNPNLNKEIVETNLKITSEKSGSFPLGTYNIPETWKAQETETGTQEVEKVTFDPDYNKYYLEDSQVSLFDTDTDQGILEFDTDNISDYIIIRAFNSYMAGTYPAILTFDLESTEKVNENFSVTEGSYKMGRVWYYPSKSTLSVMNGSGNASRNNAEASKELKRLFKPEVSAEVAKDGKITATFEFKKDIFSEEAGDKQIISVEIGTNRNVSPSNSKYYYMTNDINGTTFEKIDLTKTTFTVEFKNLLDSHLIRIQTAGGAKDSKVNKRYMYVGRLYLTQNINFDAEPVTVTLENGAVLKTDTDSFTVGKNQFICINSDENLYDSSAQVKSYSKTDKSLAVYKYYIADSEGNRVIPESTVVFEFPIPEDFNPQTTAYLLQSTGFGLPRNGKLIENENGKRSIQITPENLQSYDDVFAIYDTGDAMTEEELSALSPGYYRVRPTFRMLGSYDRPSMAAPAIVNREGILHIAEDGSRELYLNFRGVSVSNSFGYISKVYYRTLDGGKYPVNILAYKSTADLMDKEWSAELEAFPDKVRSEEDLNIDSFTNDYELHYLQTICIPLGEMNKDNEWTLNFVVPLMNAFGGDIKTSVKEAGLRLISGTCDQVSEEDCPKYSNSLLLGTIDEAEWLLEDLEEGEASQALSDAIASAKASYQELKTVPNQEKLKAAVSALNEAIAAAGGNQSGNALSAGTYQIPFKLWNAYDTERETESIYKDSFGTANLQVRDNTMTIDLPLAQDAVVEGIRYYSESEANTVDAEMLTDAEGKVTGFRLIRPYDEKEFRVSLTVTGKAYTVSAVIELDFKNAVKVAASDAEVQALKNLLTEIQTLIANPESSGKYTASSFAALQEAANNAQTALDASDSLEYDTVMTQTERLTTAKNGLIEKAAIQSMLEQKLNETVSYMDREDSYTEESFTKLKEAVKTANSVLSSYAMTDEKIAEAEAAMDAIDAAIEGLKSKKLAELEAAIAEAETISGSSYTEASYQAFESALQKAKETAADSNAADEDYTQALTALNAAKEGLEQKTDPTPDPENPGTAEKELKELYQKQRSTLTKEDSYEETSFASWKTSMDEAAELLNDSRGYTVTEAQYEAAAAALKAEYQALILQSELDKDADAAIAAYASWAEEEEAVGETVLSVTASASNALRTASASNAARKVQTISLFALETAALAEAQTQSEDEELDLMALPDGTYRVDYCLWQFNADDYSMGNDALVDAYPEISGKQAKVTVSDGKVYLWLDFQKKTASGLTGRLLTMDIMTNIVKEGTSLKDYTKVAPVQTTYTDETDQYLPAGKKYPQTMVFDVTDYVTAYKTQIPVFVNVPVMGASAEQPAYINLYYDTFAKADAGTDVPGGDDTEYSIDLEALQTAMKTASAVDGSKYTETSYAALEASYEAADRLLSYADDELATQTMADNRTAALTATRKALIPKAGTDVPEEPENPDTPSDPTTEDTSVAKAKLQELIKYAGTLNQMQYTDASWTSMNLSLVSARGVYAAKTATTAELTAAAAELTAAIKALVPASDSDGSGNDDSDTDNDPGSDGTSSKNGYYKVKVRLWHASMNKASMGDDAVVKTAYVHIEDGDVTMRLVTKEMETSGITAHLHDFYIYRDGDYQSATLAADTGEYWIYEFELPNSSSQFYKCKVDPQVDVMGDEPVKARLKVNWSGKKSIDSDDWDSVIDDPDDIISTSSKSSSSSGSGVTGSAELVDNETGAKLTGNIGAPGVKLEVKKIDQGGVYDSTKSTLADKNQFVLYDVKVTVNGEQVQPSESVKLRLPIPIGFDASRITAYRISEDGSARSEIAGTVNGSYYEFSVDHFSLFALSEVPAADTAVTTAQADGQTTQAAAAGSAQAVPQAQASGNGGSTGSSGYTSAGSAGSSSGNTGRSTTGTTGSGFSFSGSGNTGSGAGNASDGTKDIPYTGDTTPVTAMAGIGAVALLIFFSTFVPKKKRKEN